MFKLVTSFIRACKQDGLTALHKAIIGKKEAVISHLLRKGADPHVKDQVRIKFSFYKHVPVSSVPPYMIYLRTMGYLHTHVRMELLHFIMQFKLVPSKL